MCACVAGLADSGAVLAGWQEAQMLLLCSNIEPPGVVAVAWRGGGSTMDDLEHRSWVLSFLVSSVQGRARERCKPSLASVVACLV